MSDDPNRIRFCGVANCNVRMSAVSKDPHVVCPVHTGFVCNMDKRCDICKEWSVQRMQDYVKLQKGRHGAKRIKNGNALVNRNQLALMADGQFTLFRRRQVRQLESRVRQFLRFLLTKII